MEGKRESLWRISLMKSIREIRVRPETGVCGRQKITAMSLSLSLSFSLIHTMIYYLKRQEN